MRSKIKSSYPCYIDMDGAKNKRIVLAVTNDLVTDQRVHRSCMALHEDGFVVTLIGRHLPDSIPVHRPYRTLRMHLLFRNKALFYAEYNLRLLLRLLTLPADVFYANDTDTLPAVYMAAVMRRKRIMFDAHELFTEVPELANRPRVKYIWRVIEDFFMPRLVKRQATTFTVCHSIADIYNRRYGLKMQVVRNVPLPYDASTVRPYELPQAKGRHVLLYQGAVNMGRGIEWMLAAMPLLNDCLFVVAGVGDLYDDMRQLSSRLGVDDRVLFLGRLEPEELRRVTCRADLGISLLENKGLNYYYSLPNRLADFVQAGVPVLATDFPEIRRVVSQYEVGTLLADGSTDPVSVSTAVREALLYWQQLPTEVRQARFARAAAELSWEHDKVTLVQATHAIFEENKRFETL